MMIWALSGCCGLALLSLAAAFNATLQVGQRPRFYGLKTGRSAVFSCISRPRGPGQAQWFKAAQFDVPWEDRTLLQRDRRTHFQPKDQIQDAVLILRNLQPDDSAVYFCRVNGTPGPGTQLQAARPVDLAQAGYRSRMKDGLMVLQGLLLAAGVAAVLLRKQKLEEKTDSLYEEPESDHIYQSCRGLEVEACGGGLYEELSVYAQPEGAEAPWE